ncbi:uncharacterized protein LOC143053936 [Mytilus galloprovincialis]|uniref:uncharacterized protein LOC143053936 n=1 Tax=Mytilus galloprovincialis TaxID=29158 RepID=UPI003F7B3B33
MEEEMLFERLSKFCFEKAMSILCFFINVKVLKNGRFEVFLNTFKHDIFHQWIIHLPCCECKHAPQRTYTRRVLTEPQMATLYDFTKTVTPGHETTDQQGRITQYCICKYIALPGVKTTAADIGTLHCLLKIFDNVVFWRVKQQIEVIRKIRNELSHSASRILKENDFKKKWLELETAVLFFANEIDPSFKEYEAKQISASHIAAVTPEEFMRVIDDIKRQREISLNREKQVDVQYLSLREHIFRIENLLFKIQSVFPDYHHSSPKTTEQSSQSWKCCLCCPSYGSRYFYAADSNLAEDESNPVFNRVIWTVRPPDNWDVEKILQKIQHNYSALAAVGKESIGDGSLIIEKQFRRQVVEDQEHFESETVLFYKQMVQFGEIDVKTPAEISVDCTVKNTTTDHFGGDFNEEFYLKNTLQVYVEKASNDPNLNLVDIKSFKDGRIVIADKNLHQIMHFSDEHGKGQLLRSIKLDGAPTSLDIIDNTTVCVTVPNEGIVVLDVNSGKQQKPITVEGKCCSIMYRKDYFFVGCENGTLKVLSRSEDMKQTVFPLQFEPSGICGQIDDDGRIFVMFCQSTQDNRIYRVKIDVEDINQKSSRYPVHVTLEQSVGTAHFGLTMDDDDNLIFLDNKNLYKAYNEGTRTPVLSPSKEISCMHYDMLSKTMLLVTVGGEIMFYAKYNTRL